MNYNANPGEGLSESSVVSNFQEGHRRDVARLLTEIREILNNDFHVISTDESVILNLIRLIKDVGVFKNYLSDAEMGFCLAIMFYADLFRVSIRKVDDSLAVFNHVQQEYNVIEDEFNLKDRECAAISSALADLFFAKDKTPESEYEKREKIDKDIEDLRVSYFEVIGAIDAGINEI